MLWKLDLWEFLVMGDGKKSNDWNNNSIVLSVFFFLKYGKSGFFLMLNGE